VTPVQAVLFIVAVILLFVAAFGPPGSRPSFALLGAAVALLAYAEPGLAQALGS
jgi:hypothetical protein